MKDIADNQGKSTVQRLLSLFLAIVCFPQSVCAGDIHDIAFFADHDGTEQRYILLLPEGFEPDAERDLLIALHGHGSDRHQFVTQDRGECFGTRKIAKKYGMILLSPDYRAKTSWMNAAAEADLVQIIDTMKKTHSIKRVFLIGGSMGGTAALTFAVLHPERIDGVVVLNGTANLLEYDNFQDAISESYGGTKSEIPLEYKKRSAEYFPEKLTMPVAITASGRDTAVPPESVLRLAKILKLFNPHVLLIYREEAGHETDLEDTVTALEYVIMNCQEP